MIKNTYDSLDIVMLTILSYLLLILLILSFIWFVMELFGIKKRKKFFNSGNELMFDKFKNAISKMSIPIERSYSSNKILDNSFNLLQYFNTVPEQVLKYCIKDDNIDYDFLSFKTLNNAFAMDFTFNKKLKAFYSKHDLEFDELDNMKALDLIKYNVYYNIDKKFKNNGIFRSRKFINRFDKILKVRSFKYYYYVIVARFCIWFGNMHSDVKNKNTYFQYLNRFKKDLKQFKMIHRKSGSSPYDREITFMEKVVTLYTSHFY